MSEIAFTVYGFPVTAAQCDQARAVMHGQFTVQQVWQALSAAGVCNLPGRTNTVPKAADRILQMERKAGRIQSFNRAGTWERIAA